MATKKNATAVAVQEDKNTLPAYLNKGKTASLGNLDSTDRIVPRVKLLQSVSPEVTEIPGATVGEFWHTVAGQSLGGTLKFIPILIRKSYNLWAPRGDDRGILARATDAVHWDRKEEFEVKPKGSTKKVTWDTREGTVAGSGLDKFGSSIPDDSDSAPAASLTYDILAHLPDFPELSPVIILNTRSSVKPAKNLISKIEMRPTDHYNQIFSVSPIKQGTAGESFYNYNYTSDGYATEGDAALCKSLYESFKASSFRANDEGDEAEKSSGPSETKKF